MTELKQVGIGATCFCALVIGGFHLLVFIVPPMHQRWELTNCNRQLMEFPAELDGAKTVAVTNVPSSRKCLVHVQVPEVGEKGLAQNAWFNVTLIIYAVQRRFPQSSLSVGYWDHELPSTILGPAFDELQHRTTLSLRALPVLDGEPQQDRDERLVASAAADSGCAVLVFQAGNRMDAAVRAWNAKHPRVRLSLITITPKRVNP